MHAFRVLVVDDEEIQRETLAQLLRDQKYQVVTSPNVDAAKTQLLEMEFDIVVTDFRMPGSTGLDLARYCSERAPDTYVIVMTAFADVNSVIESMRLGVIDYLLKPLNVDLLIRKIAVLKERSELSQEVAQLRKSLNQSTHRERMIGTSASISLLREQIKQIAPNRTTVLVTGESGTGKEVVARELHLQSPLASKKFVAVNCGAISENLLESELFGHRKGSFTGAVADRDGLFVAAHGGTLFLDEIGELPRGLQVKLLRALQEREVLPVGETSPIKVDVRVIAATNRDLQKEVADGNFRQDLYYRINVVELKLPPLRDRAEDIPVLAQTIIARLNSEMGKHITAVSGAALKKLMAYRWPGNVRELENVLERALILTTDTAFLEASGLPAGFQSLGSDQPDTLDLDTVLKSAARVHISRVLEQSGGDKKEAARLLGMGLSSLYRKMEELDITGAPPEGTPA